MPPIQMTRAEYQAQYGTAPAVAPVSSSAPIKMTRAEYQAQYGAKPSVNASTDKASAEKYGATFGASTENPSILGEAAKTLGNMPSSAWNFAKGALDIVNPISTINKLREAGSTFGKLAQEQGGVGNALGLVAKEAPKALYEGLVPEAGRALLAGDTETAQRAITNDPVGQILPFLAAARGGAKMADTAATKTAMADYAKAPYSTRTIPEPITKYSSAFDTGVSKVTEAVTKPISTVAGKVSDYTKGMVQGGVSQTTGLGRETVSRVTAFPEAFTKKAIAETDRASLGKQVQSELAKLSEEKIATGKEYAPIRASAEPVRVDPKFFENTIKETTGLDIKKGQLTPTGSSKLRDSGDVRAVQKVYDFWKPYFKKGQLTTDEFLNMREDLAKMAKFEKDIGVRKDVQTLSGIMRAKFNEAYRPQIGGLKELDASMHDQLKQFKELTHGLVDKEGNMTDAGMAKIANLSANKPNLALQLEKIVPGITEQIKNLQAITDIERASGIKAFKTGTYVRGALTGGAFLGAGIPAGILTMIMTDPAIAVPILRQYGLLKNSRAVNTVIQALKEGGSRINALPAGVPEPLKKDVGQAYTDINKTMAGKGGLSMQDVTKPLNAEGKGVFEIYSGSNPKTGFSLFKRIRTTPANAAKTVRALKAGGYAYMKQIDDPLLTQKAVTTPKPSTLGVPKDNGLATPTALPESIKGKEVATTVALPKKMEIDPSMATEAHVARTYDEFRRAVDGMDPSMNEVQLKSAWNEVRRWKESPVLDKLAEYKLASSGDSAATEGIALQTALKADPKMASTIARNSIEILKKENPKTLYRYGDPDGLSWTTKPDKYFENGRKLQELKMTPEVLNRVIYAEGAEVKAGYHEFPNTGEGEVILRESPKSTLGKPETTLADPLAQEAKKYKSVKDFEKSLDINMEDNWRGNKHPEADRIAKIVEDSYFHGTTQADAILKNGFKKDQYFNSGAYFAKHPNMAIDYKNQSRGGGKTPEVLVVKLDNLKLKDITYQQIREITKGYPEGETLVKKLKNSKYNGVQSKEVGETLVWDVSKIKKPETLTELWEKSQKSNFGK